MAYFSFYQQPTFFSDSFLLPNNSIKMASIAEPEEGTKVIATNQPYFPPVLGNECSQEIPMHAIFHETNGPLQKTDMAIGGHQIIQMVTSNNDEEKKRKNVDIKKGKERKYNGAVRKPHLKKQKKKVAEEASPSGYVHVRARRGQATDSHSLAERVRRAKISERMKLLQSLVPGCDKITGKALILDEVIKYVQTLQTQVEFLAVKLASVTPMFNDSEVDFIANPFAQEYNGITDHDHGGRRRELANSQYELGNFHL